MGEEKQDPDKSKGGDAPKAPESPWTGLWKSVAEKLGPALVSLIVSVGFVAFAGKAVLWVRFDALQVPPDQVVKVVPQDEAVAVGASMLLLFGLLGVLATLGVYLVDRGGRATPGMSRGLLAILAVEALVAIWFVEGRSVDSRVIASELVLLAVAAIFWSTFVAKLVTRRPEVPDLNVEQKEEKVPKRAFFRTEHDSGVTLVGVLVSLGAALLVAGFAYGPALVISGSGAIAWIAAIPAGGLILLIAVVQHWARFEYGEKKAKDAAREKRRKKEKRRRERKAAGKAAGKQTKAEKKAQKKAKKKARKSPGNGKATMKPSGVKLTPWGLLLTVLLTIVIVAVPSLILHEWWLAVSLGAVAVLGAGLWRISSLGAERFVWYGLAVFISVPLFGTVMLMARNVDEPQVQPMALIRNTDGPDEAIQGLYVTETSDRVYFSNVATEGCEGKLEHNSGRLLWVPTKEVVAMSIGPLQSVHDAGKAALEMSYALTPATETPSGENGSLTTSEQRAQKTEELTVPLKLDQRLENAGPAVRPNFGSGLKLIPETASPGGEVTLRMSDPNEQHGVDGFGETPEGRALRLNGIRLAVLRETAINADEAEYVRTKRKKTVLRLEKRMLYGFDEDTERFFPLRSRPNYDGFWFVKLIDGRVLDVVGGGREDTDQYLAVDAAGRLVRHPKVIVEGESAPLLLEPRLLRQAWSKDEIKFRVPDNAATGVVTVECDQLAGQPLLRVAHAPTARIAVQMQPDSAAAALDSSRSGDEDKADREHLTRRWEVDGLESGHQETMTAQLPPRRGPYSVKLTVTDRAGNSDTAKLRLLRLPTSLFAFDRRKPLHPRAIEKAREAVEAATAAEKPVEIELDGHADNPGSPAYNLKLSLARDDHVRQELLQEPKNSPTADQVVPVQELAYGESCQIDKRGGRRPRNRRVDVFVLDRGVTVKPADGCHPGRVKALRWHLPPPKEGGGDEPESDATTSSASG